MRSQAKPVVTAVAEETPRLPIGTYSGILHGIAAKPAQGCFPPPRQVCWLQLSAISANPRQPRREFDPKALADLAESIRQYGLLQPIMVRAKMNGAYEIISGERRVKACRMLGMTHIDAIIQPATAEDSGIIALVENLQRQNLHYLEQAEAYMRLMNAYGMRQDELARSLGRSPTSIANKVRLLTLDEPLRKLLMEEGLSERHAHVLLRLPDAEARMRIAANAATERLTVHETELLVEEAMENLPVPPPDTRRIIALMRDHRLYINAIQGIVEQMQDAGLQSICQVYETDAYVEMRVHLPKIRTRSAR